MAAKSLLNGLKVLVTRPKQQANALCDLITAEGGEAIAFPVIEITAILPDKWMHTSLLEQDMLIFISRNAVVHFMSGHPKIAPSTQMVAVGNATAKAMREHGLRLDIQAPSPAGSESLLAMSVMQDVQTKHIVIVRGEGGRELLADTLSARGATIRYIETYQRQLASATDDDIEQAKKADSIVITSIAGLTNLYQLLGEKVVREKPLIVVSERIKQRAMTLGCQKITVADDAGDSAVMKKVREGAML